MVDTFWGPHWHLEVHYPFNGELNSSGPVFEHCSRVLNSTRAASRLVRARVLCQMHRQTYNQLTTPTNCRPKNCGPGCCSIHSTPLMWHWYHMHCKYPYCRVDRPRFVGWDWVMARSIRLRYRGGSGAGSGIEVWKGMKGKKREREETIEVEKKKAWATIGICN